MDNASHTPSRNKNFKCLILSLTRVHIEPLLEKAISAYQQKSH